MSNLFVTRNLLGETEASYVFFNEFSKMTYDFQVSRDFCAAPLIVAVLDDAGFWFSESSCISYAHYLLVVRTSLGRRSQSVATTEL